MTILVKEADGSEAAVNMLKGEWRAHKTPGDDSTISIMFEDGREITVKDADYVKIKEHLSAKEGFLVL